MMKIRRLTVTILLACLAVTALMSPVQAEPGDLRGYTGCSWGSDECNPCVPNVILAVYSLRQYGDIMGFHMNGYPDVNSSNHWQGIQRLAGDNSDYMIVSRSHSSTGAFAVVRMYSREDDGERFRSNRLERNTDVQDTAPPSSDGIVHYEAIDSDYDHAGGVQTIGNWVAIPLEGSHSGANAKVVFYDLSNPTSPIRAPYEVVVPSEDAGTASVTKLSDGTYLLVVGGKDANPLWFYISEGTTLASDPNFQLKDTWHKGEQDSEIGDWNWGAYQNINIVNQCDGTMYLIGLHNDSPVGLGDDWIDVYRLEVDSNTYDVGLVKVAMRHVYSDWGGVPKQCNLDAAAGVYIDPEGRLIVYATEHDNDGPLAGDPTCTNGPDCSVKFMEFRNQFWPTSCQGISNAWVELYSDRDWSGRGLMIDFADRDLETYDNFEHVEGFNDKTSSAAWCLPSGFRYVLFEDDHYRGDTVELYGDVGLNQISDFDDIGFGDDTSSGRFEGESEGEWYPVLAPRIWDGSGGPLEASGSPYLIAGDICVPSGNELTIHQGVTLIFKEDEKMIADGMLTADGSDDPIWFVSGDNRRTGMKISSQFTMKNGGELKIP
jgi:hypothetical protein